MFAGWMRMMTRERQHQTTGTTRAFCNCFHYVRNMMTRVENDERDEVTKASAYLSFNQISKVLKFQLMLLIMIKQKAISACTTTQDEMMNDVIVSLTGTCVFRKWFESSFSNKFNGISSCAEGREESFSIMTSRLINTSHYGGARSMPFLHSLS